MIFFIS